jgi:hypothetical protein
MCPKRSIKLVILALALLATTSPWVRAQDQIVGIVGKWEVVGLKGSCPAREDPKFKLTNTLGFGQPICENTCVAGGSGTLTVEFPGKPSVLGVFACEDKPNPDCDRPIGKKCAFAVKPPVEKHWVVSLATEVMAMFSEPERYITPVSRGLEPHLVDSVIALEGNRADFGPAFADMDPGTYKIRLEPMAEKGSGSTVQVEWRGKGPVSDDTQQADQGGQQQGGDQGQQGAADNSQPQPQAEPQSIEKGMTTDQVEAAMGKPEKIVNLGPKKIYVYKDLKVTFLNGKVFDVQ